MIKILIGGSPCTHWSIAQSKNRETTAEGLGWELFQNYIIALKKYKPDFFLYENNKSMAQAIREQITAEFGLEPILINSALVSAQNRQRLYWVGRREADGTYSKVDVTQPEDRGILLRDILETGTPLTENEMDYMCRDEKRLQYGYIHHADHDKSKRIRRTCVAEPVKIGEINGGGQGNRIYSVDGKSVSQTANGGGAGGSTGLYAEPVIFQNPHGYNDGGIKYDKAPTVTAGGRYESNNHVLEPAAGRVVGRRIGEDGHRDDYNPDVPCVQRFEVNENPQKTNCLTTVTKDNMVAVKPDGKEVPVYEVLNGLITIKGKTYPIKLADGFYIIRKLTVCECMRLQTVPEWYHFPVSNSQAYKMLGNGWTVEVIAHIMSHFGSLQDRDVEVLSMYDGMSCGHIALDGLGANVTAYYATEIDKFAVQTTQHNYPQTIQLGDAFSVRDPSWTLGGNQNDNH